MRGKLQRGSIAEKRVKAAREDLQRQLDARGKDDLVQEALDRFYRREKQQRERKPSKPVYEKVHSAPPTATLETIMEELEGGDARLLDDSGSVRMEALLSDGIRVGTRVIPWPTLKTWLQIDRLQRGYHAAVAYGATTQHLTAGMLGGDEGRITAAAGIRAQAVQAWADAQIQYKPDKPEDIWYGIAYGLVARAHEEEMPRWAVRRRLVARFASRWLTRRPLTLLERRYVDSWPLSLDDWRRVMLWCVAFLERETRKKKRLAFA